MKRRGLTLAELLMAMFLLATVTSMMMMLLFPSLWMWRAEQAHSEVQQGVLVACSRLQQMLLNCQLESLTVSTAPAGIALQEVVSDSAGFDAVSGNPILESQVQVVYYDSGSRKVIQKTWKDTPALAGISFTSTPCHLVRLSPAHIAQVSSSGLQPRTMATNVEVFEISDQDKDLTVINPPLTIRVRCQLTLLQSPKQEAFEMTVAVTPRSLRL